MTHPHKSLLDEFKYAIDHFVSTVPEDVTAQANKVLQDMTGNTAVDEVHILSAFHDIGIQEYPHRRAYHELAVTSASGRLNELVIEHVEDSVSSVIKPLLDSGVTLEELVSSDMFTEKLTPEQRYQVEDGILVSKSKLADELAGDISAESDEYKKLLKKWEDHAKEIDAAIGELKTYASGGTNEQKEEIIGKAERFAEGFMVTERDPELEEVRKEIEYWKDTFAEEE